MTKFRVFQTFLIIAIIGVTNTSVAMAQVANPLDSSIFASSTAVVASSTAQAGSSTAATATSTYMTSGKASWYGYMGGMFAASPDFKYGTRLKVTSASNPSKSIVVTVNDFGPDRVRHPDRVIDLDKVAFAQLAPLGAGVIDVIVAPLESSSSAVLANIGVVKKTELVSLSQTGEIAETSRSAIVLNARSGKVIYAKNATEQLPLASLTKLVAMKVYLNTKPNLNKIVTYKSQDEEYNYQYAERRTLAKLKVKNGETMTARDMLYSAVLGSANNAVESLVRTSGLNRKIFIARMNTYAKKAGAKKTRFIEPTGLSPDNVSTAKDYALIAKAVLADGNLERVSATRKYSFVTKNTKKKHIIRNSNSLFFTTDLKITGSKTGYLEEAQYCLMTRAKDSRGRQVIAVTFGTPTKAASYQETLSLLDYGFKKYN